ncbi:hypothetical protein MLD38_028172 [Melastoma candidum]|uniref:Uncharacterized protein n=1 Tax=Melastoma candidum TaxID=119954 RepID=A0ACB9N2E3_9MYRT|nr:hypothetical protein MLD38_028172 [Melastoma candidum]
MALRNQGLCSSWYEGLASSSSPSSVPATFNVLDFGAKGDGKTDDTKAFDAAWSAACKLTGPTMLVPSGYTFLVKPISFSGPNCGPNIVFQLEGKIIAPTDSQAWGSGILQWIEFTKLSKITIKGYGVIEGQGSVWRSNSMADKVSQICFFASPIGEVLGIGLTSSLLSYTESLTSMLTLQNIKTRVTTIASLRENGDIVGCDPNTFVCNYLVNVLNFTEDQTLNLSNTSSYSDHIQNKSIAALFLEDPYEKAFFTDHCQGDPGALGETTYKIFPN